MDWSGVHDLANCSEQQFHTLVNPLGEMAKLSYTATFGSYFEPEKRNASVVGWTRGLSANPQVGMRALLFLDQPTGRGVVAFRGTDLDQTQPSGQADACADHRLSGKAGVAPAFCKNFDNATLDYVSRAAEFVQKVNSEYPEVELLFTGHSLGAALAFVTASSTSSRSYPVAPAVAFSSPSWLDPLRQHGGRVPSSAETYKRFYAIADWYDPVQGEAIAQHGLRGQVCTWKLEAPSLACRLCFAPPSPFQRNLACKLCFSQRHVYKHYIHDLIPGPRPQCVNASSAHVPSADFGLGEMPSKAAAL